MLNKLRQKLELFNTDGEQIEVCYIGNLFIKEFYKRKNKYSLWMTAKRLGKLVLLAEIKYMQENKRNLIKQDYENYPHLSSLIIMELYHRFCLYQSVASSDVYLMRIRMKETYTNPKTIAHNKYELKLNSELKDKLYGLIEEIYGLTEYIDTVDLVELLRVDFPKYNVPEGYSDTTDKYLIPKHLIYQSLLHQCLLLSTFQSHLHTQGCF